MRNLMKICTVLFWHLIALFWILSSLYITLIMGRAPCCEKLGLKKGPWTNEEDHRLKQYIQRYGDGCWRTLPKKAGLSRCGKSCRLRWINYLQPNLKRGNITEEEDRIIIESHAAMGNRWSMIASKLPGRTDNEIKNYWNTHLKKKLRNMGLDPKTHQPLQLRNMALDPKTHQHLQLPNMVLDPKTHQPLQLRNMGLDPKANQPLQLPNMGLDPKTHQPLQLRNMGLDPNTHQPLHLRNMGLDPKTHQPLQLPNMGLDPKTRQPVQLRNMGLDPKTHQPLQLRNMVLDPKTHQPLQGSSATSTSIPEMIKMEARSVKGKNSNSKEDLCCGEIVFSPSYNFSEDYKFPPSSRSNIRTTTNLAPLQPSSYYFNEACKFTMCQCISLSSTSGNRDTSKNIAPVKLELGPEPQANSVTNLANHMTVNCRGTSDIRGRGTNIAHRKVNLSPGPQANSITNLVPSWSGFNILDTVNHCPAAVSSTEGQDVGFNTIATNTVNSMSVDNNPSAMHVPVFSNISSPNPMLSLVGNGHFWDSPIINMGEQHSNVEEASEAAAQWARAFNDLIWSDMWA